MTAPESALARHARRTVRWTPDGVEAHPDALTADGVAWIAVPTPSDPATSSIEAEGLPCVRLPDGTARIACVPAFAYGISLGDVVDVTEHDSRTYVSGVRDRGGFAALRVHLPAFPADATTDDSRWLSLARALAPHGAWVDLFALTYIAIAVPNEELQAVSSFLGAHERAGTARWELAAGDVDGVDALETP